MNASWPKHAGLLASALAILSMGMTPVAADPIFDSTGITNPVYPTPHISARADWSSDLGADYQFELKGDPINSSNPVFGVGQGYFTSSDSGLTPFDSGFNLHYSLDSKGGGAGNTYSEGWLSVPDSGPVDPNQVFEFRLRNVLGDNNPGLGISTEAQILTNFYFGNVTFLKDTLTALERKMTEPLRAVVIDASGINQLDSSAEAALREIDLEYSERGVRLIFARVKGPVRDVMYRSGFLQHLDGEGRIVFRTHDAVQRAAGRPVAVSEPSPEEVAGGAEDPRNPADRVGCGKMSA